MTTQTIENTLQAWAQQPAKALGRPAVKAHFDGASVSIEAGSFQWKADLPASLGGTNRAPSPTALLLGALAGCAVAFVKDTLAPQLGVRVDGVQAAATCEADSRGLLGVAGVSPDLRNLALDLTIESPDGDDAIEQLMTVWKERCPIYLALAKPIGVEVTAKVVNWYEK